MAREEALEKLVKKEVIQVFVLYSRASIPLAFAVHAWFVVNRYGTLARWEIIWHEHRGAISWGHLHENQRPPFKGLEIFEPVKGWNWGVKLIKVVEGGEDSLAKKMADFIERSPVVYPHRHDYSFIGFDSNTYVQWVLNHFVEAGVKLPWNAFGKDKAFRIIV
jgi:hypothetical protein